MLSSHETYKEIFADADRALYHAKEEGRNCVAYMQDGEVKKFVDKPLGES
jgi:predicted signal transduction protein with EAL and GGDEF domain